MRWHVSSIHGDDRNDGKSPESALRTLWAAARLPFSNGDELLLECGSVFTHEALHLRSVDGLRISTYGEGPRPVVDAMGQGIWWQDYGCLLDNPNHVWSRYAVWKSATVMQASSARDTVTLERWIALA